jgi:DNA-binding MarR family transcriptional regulator
MQSKPRTELQLSDEELAAWGGLLRTHAQLVRELDAELSAAHGLPLSSYEVLLKLAGAAGGRMRMSEIADAVLLSRSGLTRLIDRLDREGLVQREACHDDARGQWAVLTERGRSRFTEAQQTHLAGVRRRFLDQLGPRDLSELSRIWRVFDTA